jgi:hypothetical protein
MAPVTYDKEITALLVIDPYNDFISEGARDWRREGKWRTSWTANKNCRFRCQCCCT